MYLNKYGTGERVFLGLHGWGGDHTTFSPLVRRLPEGVTLYSADLPGYGKTPAPREWSLAAITGEIVSTIESLNVPQVVVIGNCSGAILGLLAAQALQGRIGRLVLIDPFAYLPLYFKVFVNPNFGKVAYYTTFANPIGRWLTNLSLKNRRASETDLTNSFQQVDHEATWQYLRLLAELEGPEQFKDLRTAIDILYGERTFKAVKKSATMFQQVWPQARCLELKGAGHLPIEEATKQLSQVVFQEVVASSQ